MDYNIICDRIQGQVKDTSVYRCHDIESDHFLEISRIDTQNGNKTTLRKIKWRSLKNIFIEWRKYKGSTGTVYQKRLTAELELETQDDQEIQFTILTV